MIDSAESSLGDIATAIKTVHIQTPSNRVVSFGAGESQRKVARKLRDLDFDHAPVLEGGKFIGFVALDELDDVREPISEKMRPINVDFLISSDTPLAEALVALSAKPMWLTLAGTEIAGLVTPYDVNKQAGRTYFFLLISELEMRIANFIRDRYRDQFRVLKWLDPGDQAQRLKAFDRARKAGTEADLVSVLYFPHILRIAGRSRSIAATLGLPPRLEWEELSGKFRSLRNDVSHPVQSIVKPGRPFGELVRLEESLRSLVENAPDQMRRPRMTTPSLPDLIERVFGPMGSCSTSNDLGTVDFSFVEIPRPGSGGTWVEVGVKIAYGAFSRAAVLSEASWLDLRKEIDDWGVGYVLLVSTIPVEFAVSGKIHRGRGWVGSRSTDSIWTEYSELHVIVIDLAETSRQGEVLALLRVAKGEARRLTNLVSHHA